MQPNLTEVLEKRMRGPQRHRLLQGYPQPPLMRPLEAPDLEWLLEYHSGWGRPMLVGVLPHAACNPTVRGCGYCTFPHEAFRRGEVRDTVEAVIKEVEGSLFGHSKVEALYFGGGTANLTPPDLFARLCDALNRRFKLQDIEVTLEGAPVYFTSHNAALLDLPVEKFPSCTHRISMGVQTFDPGIIRAMGREHIGAARHVEDAVKAAQKRGILTSADLMINMPDQTVPQMIADVRRAADLGLSQLSIYHLVLFKGLGTPWAGMPDKLRSLPENKTAYENWRKVSAFAITMGYRQTTLTNYQRDGEFRYEDCSYQPHLYDWVGFGPEALSCFTNVDWNYAAKWMNQADSAAYRDAVNSRSNAIDLHFLYQRIDMGLLYLTRGFARFSVNADHYKAYCGQDMWEDFGPAWEVLSSAGLVITSDKEARLTDRGAFFADSVVGLLAWDRIRQLRGGDYLEEPPIFRMG